MPKTALNKFYVALGGLVAVFVGVIEDGNVSNKEWGALAIAAYTAIGVWFVSNPEVPADSGLVDKTGHAAPRDPGDASVATICVVIVAVLLALLLWRALAN
jgi:hypothetical protein